MLNKIKQRIDDVIAEEAQIKDAINKGQATTLDLASVYSERIAIEDDIAQLSQEMEQTVIAEMEQTLIDAGLEDTYALLKRMVSSKQMF